MVKENADFDVCREAPRRASHLDFVKSLSVRVGASGAVWNRGLLHRGTQRLSENEQVDSLLGFSKPLIGVILWNRGT